MSNKPLSVILIRWPKGLERTNVKPTDTIGEIVNRMGKKYNFDGTKHTLIQESNKAKTARLTKLSQLNIKNGEIFQLDMTTLPDSVTSRPNSSLSTSSNKSGSRPTTANKETNGPLPPNVKNFKSMWGNNAICLSEIVGKEVVIEQQKSCKIKKILLPGKEMEMVSHIIQELHFRTKRMFFLYGTLPHDHVVRIHAVSMPSQRFNNETGQFTFNEQHRKSSDDLAKTLGLQLLGVVVSNEIKETQINPSVMLYLGKMAKDIGENFIVIAATPDAGKCSLEPYQLSDQFIKLASEDFFIDNDGKSNLIPQKEVRLYTKLSNKIDIDYFLVTSATIARESWFPRSRFPFQAFYPTVSDFAYAMNIDYQAPDFIRLLDFNMLLFLEKWFNSQNEIPMLAKTLIAKKNLPFAFSAKIEEIINSAAILKSGY